MIAASFFFALAAFFNGLNQQQFEDTSHKLLVASTSLNMCGAMMYIIGSVCFMPGPLHETPLHFQAAVTYIIASILYVLGSIVSLVRTMLEPRLPEATSL